MPPVNYSKLTPSYKINIQGDLLKRLHINFDRLERPDYTPQQVIASDVAENLPTESAQFERRQILFDLGE